MQEDSRRVSLASVFVSAPDDSAISAADDSAISRAALGKRDTEHMSALRTPPILRAPSHFSEKSLPRGDSEKSLPRGGDSASDDDSIQRRAQTLGVHRALVDIFPGVGRPGFRKATQSLPAGGGKNVDARPPLPLGMLRELSSTTRSPQVRQMPFHPQPAQNMNLLAMDSAEGKASDINGKDGRV